MQSVEEVVADSGRDSKIGSRFPFVLHITPILSLALPYQRKKRSIGGRAHAVVEESGRRGVGQRSALGRTLVEPNPSCLKPELDNVSALCPGEVVYEIERLRRIVGCRRSGEGTEAGHGDSERNRRKVRRVVDRLIHPESRLVDE